MAIFGRTKHLDFVRVYVVGRGRERQDTPVTSKDHQDGHCYWVRLKHLAGTIDKLRHRHKTYKVLRINVAEEGISSATIQLDSAVICSAKVSRIKLSAKGPCVLDEKSTICGVPVFAWGNGCRYQPRGCACPNGHQLEHKGFAQPRPRARPSSRHDCTVPPAPPMSPVPAPVPTPLQTAVNTPRKQPSPTQERRRVHIPGPARHRHQGSTPSVATAALPTTFQTMEELVAGEDSVWGATGTATFHNSILDLPWDEEPGWESSDAEDDAAQDERAEVPPAAPDAPALGQPRFEPPQDPSYDDLPPFRYTPPGGYPQDEEPSEGTVADTFLFSATTTILDGNSASGDITAPGTPRPITASLHKPADVEPGPDGMPAASGPGPTADLQKGINQDSHSSATGLTRILGTVNNWLPYG